MNTSTRRFRSTRPSRALGASFAALCAALLLGTAGAAAAAEADGWTWSVTPYVWATDIGVDVTIDDRTVVDEEIAIEDLLADVDAVAQVHLEAQRGAHGLLFDLFDVRLSDDDSRVALPAPPGGEALLTSETGMTIVELAGLYDPRGDRQGFSLLYGTRILRQTAEIDARFELDPATSITRSYEVEDTLADALVGVRYARQLSRRWSAQMRLDASAGGTELTWSAGSSLSYSFGKDGRYAAVLGYRRMVVDFDTDDATDVDMTLSGFGTGLRVTF